MPRTARTAELVAALALGGGAARWHALASRYGRTAIERARSNAEVTTLLPRICSHPSYANEFDTRVAAVNEWLPTSVAITGLAACQLYGLIDAAPSRIRAVAPSPLHVRAPRWLRLRRCVVPSAIHELDGVRVVSIAEALVHAWEEERGGRTHDALFAALREHKTTVAEIQAALAYYPRVRGRRQFAGLLANLGDGMHSYLEYRGALTVLNTPDLRSCEYQVRLVVEGNVFYVDRYHRATKTAVEFDGGAHHSSPEDRARDHWRDTLLERIGVRTVRIPYLDVMHRAARSRALVRSVIASRTSIAPRAGPP